MRGASPFLVFGPNLDFEPVDRSDHVSRYRQRRRFHPGDRAALAALAARQRRRRYRALLLAMGGRAPHRPHSASLPEGQRRAVHLRRARGERSRARPHARADAEERAAARRRRDQPGAARNRSADARLCAGARGLGQGFGDGRRAGDGRCGVLIVARYRLSRRACRSAIPRRCGCWRRPVSLM